MENQDKGLSERISNILERKNTPAGKYFFFIGLGAVLLAGVSGIFGYFLYATFHPAKFVPSEQSTTQPLLENNVAPKENPPSNDTLEIASDTIENIPPQEISSLDLFEPRNGYDGRQEAKYYRVGRFRSGKYMNSDLILVSVAWASLGVHTEFYRFARNGYTLTLLQRHSGDLYDGDGLIRSKFDIDKAYVNTFLEFPDTLYGPQKRQVLKKEQTENVFFNINGVRQVFRDATFGNVFTTDTLDSGDVLASSSFSQNGFYLRAPDGTVRTYSLVVDFYDDEGVPLITWNDGKQNKERYTDSDIGGCGSRNYISVVSQGEVDRNKDLKPAGVNSMGDTIYELVNQNHPLLKNVYENDYGTLNGQYDPLSGKKVSYEEFLTKHPMFFWVDPFGRLIKFQSSEFLRQVECGKPVIYLYPEKTENVSVKIEPKGGMSVSEPDYKNGWFVRADSESNLTELSSGKNYPYLFWEGRGGIYEQPKNGFVVEQKDVHDFLVEKLAKLGLNEKETNDFLEFWEPRMQGSPYYFVTFLGNRDMDRLAPLSIDPKPDTVIRILMDFSPLAEPISVKGYDIQTPERKGFTVVEWGGVLR